MKKVMKHMPKVLKIITVLLLFVSLTTQGIFAAQRLVRINDQIDKDREIKLIGTQLNQGPPSPDELPGKMNTKDKPNTEQTAYDVAPVILKFDNNELKFKLYQQEAKKLFKQFIDNTNNISIISSLSNVTSDLGRQFTLVGEKPSGTS